MQRQQLSNGSAIRPLRWPAAEVPHLTIEVTSRCDLRCRRCYRKAREGGGTVKSVGEIKAEIDLGCQKRRVETVSLLGGEPTLHPGLPAIVRHVKSKGLVCQVLTNGRSLLRDSDGVLLATLLEAGVDRFIVHIDRGQVGPGQDIEAARRLLFERLEAAGVYFSLAITAERGEESLAVLARRYSTYRFFDGLLVTLATEPGAMLRGEPEVGPDLAPLHDAIASDLAVEPASYVASSHDEDRVCWLNYFYYLNAETGRAFAISPRLSRLFRWLYRLVRRRHLFGAAPRPALLVPGLLLTLVIELVCIPRRLGAARALLRGSRWGRALRFQYIVIQQPPRLRAEGSIELCRFCPDATIRNGRLTPVCLGDWIDPIGAAPLADGAVGRTAASVFEHLEPALETAAQPRRRRWPIVTGYLLLFWLLLPLGCAALARSVEKLFGLGGRPLWLGHPFWMAGAALMGWAIAVLWRRGGGLPISLLPPPRFTSDGPYRLVRHPIYLGFNLVLLGAGLACGHHALAAVVAPAFFPAWVAYALIEERGCLRRFGRAYQSYRRRVGLLPRLPLQLLAHVLFRCWRFPLTVIGAERIPARGAAVLVANHACYLDPVLVAAAARRPVHFVATAELFRGRLRRWLAWRSLAIPLRRYRPDPLACAEMLQRLAEGQLVGIFPEGERSPAGEPLPILPRTAAILARLQVPVIPLGLDGNYGLGPRWSDQLRVQPVTVRIGSPVVWGNGAPEELLARALRSLLRKGEQQAPLRAFRRDRLARVIWCCPACGADAPRFTAEELSCRRCGERWTESSGGVLLDRRGRPHSLAGLACRCHDHAAPAAGEPLSAWAEVSEEPSIREPIAPLRFVGHGLLRVGRGGLQIAALSLSLSLPLSAIQDVSVERGDTLQVATERSMWQLKLAAPASAFRFRLYLEELRSRIEEVHRAI